MKIAMTGIAAACAAITQLSATPALAQYYVVAPPPPLYSVAIVPPQDVMAIVRSEGFAPISRPTLRGTFYVVRAVEEDRMTVRIVVDGRNGRIVRVTETGEPRNNTRVGSFAPPESMPQDASRPAKNSAERIPLPRPAPPQTRVAAAPPQLPPNMAAVVADPPAAGKSVPAPVAERPADITGSVASASTDQAEAPAEPAAEKVPAKPPVRSVGQLELQPTVMVPVAPLE